MAKACVAVPVSILLVLGAASVASADETAPATPNTVGESPGIVPALPAKKEDQSASSYPAIGGHLGLAVPIVTFGSKTTTIGSDFATIGITPGITVHLDEKWAVDFEFIAFNELKNTPAA